MSKGRRYFRRGVETSELSGKVGVGLRQVETEGLVVEVQRKSMPGILADRCAGRQKSVIATLRLLRATPQIRAGGKP